MKPSEAKELFTHFESIRKLSHHTIRAYRLDLNRFVTFAAAERLALACDRALLHDFVKFLFEVRRLSEASVHPYFASLRSFFRWVTDQIDGRPRYVQRLLCHRNVSTTGMCTHVADASLRIRINECHPRKSILRGEG